jgi:2-keto-4-pentenoate hydratase/2-oxohepta-3-ene-1,7-dioic acid hydratase in catechol pathway
VKLANVDGRATLVRDEGGIDVARASDGRFGPGMQAVYDDWAAFCDFAGSCDAPADVVIDEAWLGAPAPSPRQVFAIGLNYRAHAQESGMAVSSVPPTFTKFPACLTGPFADVVLPSAAVDWEVELVAVIGTAATRVDAANGWSHVAGLTIGQDLSERVVQFAAGGQFSLGKSYTGFGPMGPWLVTPDELTDRDDVVLGCAVDGVTMQDARTADMIFSVPALVEALSAVCTLFPGDVIFTGTPEGIGATRNPARFLAPGEVLESWIEGIGVIRNRLVASE